MGDRDRRDAEKVVIVVEKRDRGDHHRQAGRRAAAVGGHRGFGIAQGFGPVFAARKVDRAAGAAALHDAIGPDEAGKGKTTLLFHDPRHDVIASCCIRADFKGDIADGAGRALGEVDQFDLGLGGHFGARQRVAMLKPVGFAYDRQRLVDSDRPKRQ